MADLASHPPGSRFLVDHEDLGELGRTSDPFPKGGILVRQDMLAGTAEALVEIDDDLLAADHEDDPPGTTGVGADLARSRLPRTSTRVAT